MDFGKWLQDEQTRRGYKTQQDFAEFLGIAQSQLGRYYKGGAEPGLAVIEKFSDRVIASVSQSSRKGSETP